MYAIGILTNYINITKGTMRQEEENLVESHKSVFFIIIFAPQFYRQVH